ncbi:MAG: hypothetical protein Q8O76_06070 [Chloroflexota bacterium]|nr:hypothetical protein [Chloroflexota bacterium]
MELHEDMFEDILGHQEVKELLVAAMATRRPVHSLLAGPPALAKSLFLRGVEKAGGNRGLWTLGCSSSRAGIRERILDVRPWLLLIDELDRMDGKDMGALMSLMEGGRVARTGVGEDGRRRAGLPAGGRQQHPAPAAGAAVAVCREAAPLLRPAGVPGDCGGRAPAA